MLQRYAASVIISVTYGKQTPSSYSDPDVQRIQRCLSNLGVAVRPGTYAVDSYPWLRYVPGYLSELKEQHKFELDLFKEQFDRVRAQVVR